MHILLTNDDGIRTEGLTILAQEAAKRGHKVTIVAPERQRSGFGHHVTTRTPIFVRLHTMPDLQTKAYAVDGTPADCVQLALSGELCEVDFEIVIAGINFGNNVGTDIYKSATIAAAREAALCGLRAVAVSAGCDASPESLRATASVVLDMAERYCCIAPLPNSVMNINTPGRETNAWNALIYAQVDHSYQKQTFEKRESPYGRSYYWPERQDAIDGAQNTDRNLINRNHIVISILQTNGCMAKEEYEQLGI